MNKLISKIVGAVLGVTMATGIGVGVALGTRNRSFEKAEAAYSLMDTVTATSLGLSGSYGDSSSGSYQWTQLMKGSSSIQGNSSKSSVLWNKTAFANDITKIELTVGKASAATATASIAFAASAKGTTYSTSLGSGTSYSLTTTDTLTITNSNSGCKFFTLTYTNGASYFSEIKIYSGTNTATALSAPENLEYENGTVTWDTVDHASSYSCSIDGGAYVSTGTDAFKDVSSLGVDLHYIDVKAIGDGTTYSNSDASRTSFRISDVSGTTTTSAVTIANYAAINSWADATAYTSLTIDSLYTATASSGSNNGKYYNNGLDWRFYQADSGTLSISTTSTGHIIDSITVTFTVADNGSLLFNDSAVTSDTAVTVNSNSALFTIGSTSGSKGKVKITKLSITYSESSVTYYNVSYNGNGATSGSVPAAAASYAENTSVTVLDNVDFARTGYYFNGWNTAADGSGTSYAATDSFTLTGDTTLYAKWAIDSVSSLAISGDLSKSSYSLSDVWDPSGLVVTATYAHGSAVVTNDVVWSFEVGGNASAGALSTSTSSVKFIATYEWNEDSVSSNTTKSVSVSALSSPYTLTPGTNGFGDAAGISVVGWADGVVASQAHLADVSFVVSGTGNNGKYYSSDKTWRFYESGSGALVVSVSGAYQLSSVTITFKHSNNGTLSDENSNALTSGTAWTPSSETSSQTFTVGRSSGDKAGSISVETIVVSYTASTLPSVEINQSISSLAYGATGTLTATTYNPSSAVVTWSSSAAGVISIDSSTGAYQAKSYGEAIITASITVDSHPYTDTLTIIVNDAPITVPQAIAVANGMDSGATTSYTVDITGYVVELVSNSVLMISDYKVDENGDPVNENASTIVVYGSSLVSSVNEYAVLNGTLRVTAKIQNFSGTPEITHPTLVSYTDDAIKYAEYAYDYLDATCEDGAEAVTDTQWNHLTSKWNDASYIDSYSQAKLRAARSDYSHSEDIANWMGRYEIIVNYGRTDFMESGISSNSRIINNSTKLNGSTVAIIIVVSAISLSAVGGYFMLRKKRFTK